MLKLKWKLTAIYLSLAALALFLGGVGVIVETKGLATQNLVPIMATALILTVPFAYASASALGKRIDALIEGTKALKEGIIMPRGFSDTKDELGELGGNIYVVARKLQNTIRDVSKESNKMAAILTSMLEGVVALDHIGRIVLLNRSAMLMFNKQEDEVKGSYLRDLFKNTGFEENVHRVLDQGERINYEFVFSGRILRVLMSPVSSDGLLQGAVLVFQDATEIRRLEQMRTEFVATVSHELRTPLTSIKGFVETLLDGAHEDPEVRKRFLQIIYDETARLQRLIEDLLTLSNIENRRLASEVTADAVTAYNKIVQVLSPLAQAKNIDLTVNIAVGLPKVAMGNELLGQLFLNLLENGIKYTPAGGKVWLQVGEDHGYVAIEVGDTGPGIPTQSLSRIFERFYRVDRARSREMGGTGLGLAIVKHIVEQAEGKIQVESELGRGTLFKIWIPEFSEMQESP
jgi:two-component system, OmpR family, phosphate regulon sensor histidine kinase PhoR